MSARKEHVLRSPYSSDRSAIPRECSQPAPEYVAGGLPALVVFHQNVSIPLRTMLNIVVPAEEGNDTCSAAKAYRSCSQVRVCPSGLRHLP